MKMKITYWISTGIVSLMMLFSAYSYLTQETMQQAFVHLGYPDHFRVELAIAKLLGALVLLAPLSPRIKEWAYVGFAITFVSAFVAHMSAGDPLSYSLPPLVFLAILGVSYLTYHKITFTSKIA
jgi:hypothetical protein